MWTRKLGLEAFKEYGLDELSYWLRSMLYRSIDFVGYTWYAEWKASGSAVHSINEG